jgi:hypothetical protein
MMGGQTYFMVNHTRSVKVIICPIKVALMLIDGFLFVLLSYASAYYQWNMPWQRLKTKMS